MNQQHPLVGMKIVDGNPSHGEVTLALIKSTFENVEVIYDQVSVLTPLMLKAPNQSKTPGFQKYWTIHVNSKGLIKRVDRF